MQKLYLIPMETGPNWHEIKYLKTRWGTGTIETPIAVMDYGFADLALVYCRDISPADHATLSAYPDVYTFPDLANLDLPVNDPDIDVFFEGVNIPTDWLTPSTSWRELLRQLAGMFQFNQRYRGISKGHSVWESADLDTRLNQMTQEEQAWFLAAVDSFGFNSSQINTNTRLRQLVKHAGTFWEGKPFHMGEFTL